MTLYRLELLWGNTFCMQRVQTCRLRVFAHLPLRECLGEWLNAAAMVLTLSVLQYLWCVRTVNSVAVRATQANGSAQVRRSMCGAGQGAGVRRTHTADPPVRTDSGAPRRDDSP